MYKGNSEAEKNAERKRNMGKKGSILLLVLVLFTVFIFGGCGLSFFQAAEDACPYEDFIVVDVFDSQANFQGLQSGWFAKIVKDKFNMELNIIAPNVAGGGDTLYEIRSAAGDLGDLILVGGDNGRLRELVTAELIVDISGYLADKDIMQYETAIRELNDPVSKDAIYAIPSEISSNGELMSSETSEPTYGVYLRWDVYEALGCPEMETLEDLLPVLKQMQELLPCGESGNPTYGFSFFKDWDGNLMNAAKQPACLYGYDEYGFVLAKADGSDFQSILDEDSLYMRALHLYFQANQMGLVDPNSPTQSYENVFEKYQEGEVLFGIWPWLSQSAYNTLSNKEEGRGFLFVPIKDMKIFSYGCRAMGTSQNVIAVGSKAEDPERLADFIDWLYSPEGIRINNASTGSGTAGPEGLTWEMTEEGPVLTDFGVEALMNGEVEVPEEWGGGLWLDGISALNFKSVMQSDLDPEGYPYAFSLWESVEEMGITELDRRWREYMGADSTMEYLEKNGMLLVAPGCDYQKPKESSEISTMRSRCKNIVVEYSWKMIFAEDEASFTELYETMKTKLISLGYEKVLKVDLQNAKAQDAARKEAAEKYSGEEQ